jgi:hypothetical protein
VGAIDRYGDWLRTLQISHLVDSFDSGFSFRRKDVGNVPAGSGSSDPASVLLFDYNFNLIIILMIKICYNKL